MSGDWEPSARTHAANPVAYGAVGYASMDIIDWTKGLIWVAMVAASVLQIVRQWRSRKPSAAGASASPPDAASLAMYAQAGESMRHYAALRFAMLTVLVAVATALAGLLTVAPIASQYARAWIALMAMGVTGALFLTQERAIDHWKSSHESAVALETQWGRRMFSNWGDAPLFSATNAVRLLHVLVGLLWLIVLGG